MRELKNYLKLWASGRPEQRSILLTKPITVLGVRKKQFGPRCEFAKVKITLNPAPSFEVIDNVEERAALERLGVSWPDPVVFGLEMVWYHEVDSSLMAFRHAGRDAGRKVIEYLVRSHLWSEDY